MADFDWYFMLHIGYSALRRISSVYALTNLLLRGEAVPLGSSPEPNSKQSRSGDDDDTVEVTRIWITGTPNPKTRCPLPQCINRKFAAVDMYHFRYKGQAAPWRPSTVLS